MQVYDTNMNKRIELKANIFMNETFACISFSFSASVSGCEVENAVIAVLFNFNILFKAINNFDLNLFVLNLSAITNQMNDTNVLIMLREKYKEINGM